MPGWCAPRRWLFDASVTQPADTGPGWALLRQGRLAEAEQAALRLLQRAPNDAGALHLAGRAALDAGRAERASRLLAKSVGRDATDGLARQHLGLAYLALGRPAVALSCFEQAASLRPDLAEPPYNIGLALHLLGRVEAAVDAYDTALSRRPGFAAARFNRGLALSVLGRAAASLADFDAMLAAEPAHARAWNARGNALQALGRMEAALESHLRALALDPADADALNSQGNALFHLGRNTEAAASFRAALGRRPDFPEARTNLAHTLLREGDFAAGWAAFEGRLPTGSPGTLRGWKHKEWRGAGNLAGRSLFVSWDMGLGDTLQFARFLPGLASRGARVLASVQAPLRRLLANSMPGIEFLGPNEIPPAFDLHCPMLSLALASGATEANLPTAPYLAADPTRELPGARPRIGLAWRGNPVHGNDRNRSMSAVLLRPLLGHAAFWIALHPDMTEAEQAAFGPGLAPPPAGIDDFADTAALIAGLDLVITVDTAMAHLAGGLGRPVWLMLPHSADWRWQEGREDSPWYPTARLFRQNAAGDWEGVVAAVAEALRGIS